MTRLLRGGSNLGPTSKKLRDRISEDLNRLKDENPEASDRVPAELVTASASGLDHTSPTSNAMAGSASRQGAWHLVGARESRCGVFRRKEPLVFLANPG